MLINRPSLAKLWVLVTLLLASIWGCASEVTLGDPTSDEAELDEVTFWENLPRPEDAIDVEAAQEFDLGFVTQMVEPELFDFYATRLQELGWQQQAPTEAMITLPHQIWRKGGAELVIEIRGLDEQGRTIVWLKLEEE